MPGRLLSRLASEKVSSTTSSATKQQWACSCSCSSPTASAHQHDTAPIITLDNPKQSASSSVFFSIIAGCPFHCDIVVVVGRRRVYMPFPLKVGPEEERALLKTRTIHNHPCFDE